MNPIERAIEQIGSLSRLAMLLGVSVQAVSFWRDGLRKPSAEYCAEIERLTGGHVTRRELRPEDYLRIWPELAQQEAA